MNIAIKFLLFLSILSCSNTKYLKDIDVLKDLEIKIDNEECLDLSKSKSIKLPIRFRNKMDRVIVLNRSQLSFTLSDLEGIMYPCDGDFLLNKEEYLIKPNKDTTISITTDIFVCDNYPVSGVINFYLTDDKIVKRDSIIYKVCD